MKLLLGQGTKTEIRSLIRVRDRLWNQHKVRGDQAIYKDFKIVRNQIVCKIRYLKDLQSTKRNEILCNPKVASKKWWSTYKKNIPKMVQPQFTH